MEVGSEKDGIETPRYRGSQLASIQILEILILDHPGGLVSGVVPW